MGETDKEAVDVQRLPEAKNEPAVGFVATQDNTDELVRGVVRARRKGHPCFVTHSGENPPDGALLAESLGATVVSPPSIELTQDGLEQVLAVAAHLDTDSGVLLAPPDCAKIDYHRSLERLEQADSSMVQAITRDEVSPERQSEVLVAIPAYNEAGTIEQVVEDVLEYTKNVLVIDDGSDDETAAVAREAGADVIEHPQNQGYGHALKTAFAEARDRQASTLVILDGDGQHDPSDIPDVVDRLENSDAELVIGSRFVSDGGGNLPFYRLLGMKVINFVTNLSLGVVRRESRVKDTQSGFRAYGPTAIKSLAEDGAISDDMGASTDVLHHVHRHNYRIDEVGTTVRYDVQHANSHDPIRHGLTLISNLLRTIERQRPILILGIPGLILTLVGFLLGYWSVINFISTNTVSLGIAVGTVIFSLVGIFACFTALILHSLTVHFSSELDSTRP